MLYILASGKTNLLWKTFIILEEIFIVWKKGYPITMSETPLRRIILPIQYYNLENGKKQGSFDKETVDWGKSVMNLYFSKVEHTKKINQSYTRFKNLLRSEIQEELVPYQVTNRPLLKVSYEDLLNLAIRRRSVRYYLDKKVEPEIIKKAYEIAKYSPSACNRQFFVL